MTKQQTPSGPRQSFSPAQAFERAVTLHRYGRLGEAEQIYRAILLHDPNNFGALLYLGVIEGLHGRRQEAERLIRQAVILQPKSAEAHNNLGIALAGLGRVEEALAEYEQAVAFNPSYLEARNNLGNALHALHRSGEAIPHFEQALLLGPDVPELHNNLGNALRAVHREQEAIGSFRNALAIRPDYAEANNNLGVTLVSLGKYQEAVAAYERAIALKPNYVEALNNLGNAFAALGRYAEAISHFDDALSVNPESAGTHNSYGNVLLGMKRYAEAAQHYRRAIELRPTFFEAHNNLGNAVAAIEQPAEAIAHYRKALEINPAYAEAQNNLGNVLGALARYEEAVACFRRAIAIDPKMAGTYGSLGSALITLGRIDEARQSLETAIALDPRQPEYYRSLGECKKFTLGDPHLAAMEELAQSLTNYPAPEPDSRSEEQRIVLNYGLAKAYDDVGDHEAASEQLRQGNKRRRGQVDYDERTTLSFHDRVRRIFTTDLMRSKAGRGDSSARPVFVVGMPRSGTTLIEQILASHPSVFGAGEILALHNAANSLVGPDGPLPFPEAVPAMTAEGLDQVGERYVREVSSMAPDAVRIVDKALGNFVFIGLIHLTLPNARIIHASRNAADTCFSCFSKLFASELLYTYDLGELGRYYRSYAELMEHWRRVLPRDAILEVQYEELVADFESQARRIVAYCGLPWYDRCLAFHETKRPVRTASAVQVRQPIYRTSVERWRPYAKMLQPLLDELSSANSGPRNAS